MTSEVAGLTESKFSATQAGPCSHTDVPIVLTVALCLVPVIPRFANFACFAASRASKSSPRPGQVALGAHEPESQIAKTGAAIHDRTSLRRAQLRDVAGRLPRRDRRGPAGAVRPGRSGPGGRGAGGGRRHPGRRRAPSAATIPGCSSARHGGRPVAPPAGGRPSLPGSRSPSAATSTRRPVSSAAGERGAGEDGSGAGRVTDLGAGDGADPGRRCRRSASCTPPARRCRSCSDQIGGLAEVVERRRPAAAHGDPG